MSLTILAIGTMVFFSHLLSLLFRRSNIPDVLVLTLVGITLGPVLGLVTPDDFGKIGQLLATIALVVILFESGTSLDLGVMRASLGTTGVLAFACFAVTIAVVAVTGVTLLDLEPLPALMLGVILGGTSSAVVIPMVQSLGLSGGASTVLVLESALTDVLCIVGVFALLQVYGGGEVHAGQVIGGVLASLLFAAIIGTGCGFGWMLVLGRVRGFPHSITTTLAFVLIVYGLTEWLGFSGPIAALATGVTFANHERLHGRLGTLASKISPLSSVERDLFSESVFLLKTYFFVYLGVSIKLGSTTLIAAAALMTLLVFALRVPVARLALGDARYDLRDTAIASMMAPKGLAAAVLAGLPAQHGIAGADVIQDVVYTTVLLTIVLCALLVIGYRAPLVARAYAAMLGKPPGA